MKLLSRIMSGLLLLALANVSIGKSSTALTDLKHKLAAIHTIEADFEQTVTRVYRDGAKAKHNNKAKHTNLESKLSGRIWLAKPNRFRWETDEPENQLIVADGHSIWIFDRDLEQVTVQDLQTQLKDVPLLILSGNGDALAKSYDVTAKNDGQYYLSAIDASSLIRNITITFIEDTLTSLDVEDSTGANTKILFSKSTQNVALAPSLFNFKVPEGVDVIGKEP